jgi:hypothetical protein
MSKHFLMSRAGTPLTNSQGQFLYEHITLPTEYQEVEYVETSGSNYIDSGYVLKNNRFQVDVIAQFTGSSYGFNTFVGFMHATNTNPRMGIHFYSSKYMYGANATVYNENIAIDKKKNIMVCFGNGSSQGLTVNGVSATAASSYDISGNALSMWIGARNNSGSPVNYTKAKFYRVKLSANGVKVVDMIPCYRKSDSVIGMYDVVRKSFHTSTGGALTKGLDLLELPSAYQRVEYISTNTTTGQYIDTGVIPSYVNGMKFDMEFMPMTAASRYCLLANYNSGNGQLSFEINTSNQARYYLNGGTPDVKSSNTVNAGAINHVQFYYDGTKYITNLNGTVLTGSTSITTVPNYSMFMFLDRANRSNVFTKQLRIYGCKIWVGDELLRHFIPCYRKSDNAIGMYDIVNYKFYPNQGTGSFTKGSNISN